VKILKQGVCLALLGAGLSAAPMTLASQASATPSSSVSPAALDPVQDLRDTARGQVKLSTRAATGKVGFAAVGRSGDLLPGVSGQTKAAAEAKADQYLAEFGGAFGAGPGELQRKGVEPDGYGGWVASYGQSYRGVPVFGALLRAHVNDAGALTAVNGYAAPGIDLSTDASRTPALAASRAIAFVKADPGPAATGDGQKVGTLSASTPKLYVYRDGAVKGVEGVNQLVYVTDVTNGGALRERVFVDAHSGKIVNRYSMTDNALDRALYETHYDPNNPATNRVWDEGQAFPGSLNQDQQNLVISSGESYWFFRNAFGRDSYDANGAKRITVNNDPTITCPNANWNGTTTNYCDGVTSDDVVAHEWGHAYTEYTHGLIYQWQSGALNESYSDIWGETLDLINNREDEGEGDISAPRTSSLCATDGPRAVQVVINSPANIAKVCLAGVAAWSEVPDTTGITSDIVLAIDPVEGPANTANDGCSPLTNAGAMAGHVGLVIRGGCAFTVKAQNLVNAGATAVVIGNNVAGSGPFSPGGSLPTPLDVPVVGISTADGQRIVTGLSAGAVNTTVRLSGTAETADSFRWLMGEKSDAFGGAIRDMWAPTCAGDPGKVSDIEYTCGTDDQGGVHSNSGVPNHGYALLVDGGTFNNVAVTGIGLTKAAAIYYRAMHDYQTPVSNFADHADALKQSCLDLVGKQLKELSVDANDSQTSLQKITAADCTQVDNAAAAVELRKAPVQCDFKPMLNPATPATCGPGFKDKSSFSEDFEAGLGDWTVDTPAPAFPGGVTLPWTTSTQLPPDNKPAGSLRAAFGPAPDKGQCTEGTGDFSSVSYLESPEMTAGEAGDAAGSARLSFTHNVETELGFDGGTVQISTDGGTSWDTVPATAYVFNGPSVLALPPGNTNPLAGEDGFTGTDGGEIQSDWGTSIIDLGEVGIDLGDTFNVRFAIGRDGCGGVFGWWVDNVEVTTCVVAATPTVAATHVPEPSTFGSASSINVTVSGTSGMPTGSVTVKEGSTTVGTGTLDASGKATVALPASTPAGTHSLTVSYAGDATYGAANGSVTATVNKAASTTTATAPKKVAFKKDFDVKATVSAAGGAPTGTVEVYDGTTLIGTGTLSNGTVTIHITKNLKRGKHTLTVKYLGSTNVAASQTTVTVKVKKKKHH